MQKIRGNLKNLDHPHGMSTSQQYYKEWQLFFKHKRMLSRKHLTHRTKVKTKKLL